MGICDQHAVHIRPIFVHLGIHGAGHQRTGYIASAPGEGMDLSIRHHPVKAGEHSMGQGAQAPEQGMLRLYQVQLAGSIKEHAVLRIHKLPAQVSRHNPGGEVFPPGGQIIRVAVRAVHLLKIL